MGSIDLHSSSRNRDIINTAQQSAHAYAQQSSQQQRNKSPRVPLSPRLPMGREDGPRRPSSTRNTVRRGIRRRRQQKLRNKARAHVGFASKSPRFAPPKDVHLGPGAYNPRYETLLKKNPMSGKFRRSELSPKIRVTKTEAPGPGSYNLYRPRKARNYNSAFQSLTPRIRHQIDNDVPESGAYDIPSQGLSSIVWHKFDVDRESRIFKSRTKRDAARLQRDKGMDHLGPGSYNMPKLRSKHCTAAFKNKRNRFKAAFTPTSNFTPAPGDCQMNYLLTW